MKKTLVDRLKLRISVIKQKLAYDMEPILGFNFFERKTEKFVRYTPREKIIYNYLTITGLDEYIRNHSER